MRHTLGRGTCLAALVLLLVPAQAARSDSLSCTVHQGGAGGPTLGATVFSVLNYDAPLGTTSVSGAAALPLYPSWNIFLGNDSIPVTDPTITIASGLDPSAFAVLPGPALPASCSVPSLAPGEFVNLGLAAPGSVHPGSLGYDSSAAATPAVVPGTGGEVTERFTVTVTDPGFAGGEIGISTGNGDVAVVSQAIPGNLDDGESVSVSGDGQWDLTNAQLGKTYVFTALVDIGASTPASAPYTVAPTAMIDVHPGSGCDVCSHSTGSSVSVADAGLDGAFVFSVDESVDWAVFHGPSRRTFYPYARTPLACKSRGWTTYGIFKNQGDCVSYVATDGRNAPG